MSSSPRIHSYLIAARQRLSSRRSTRHSQKVAGFRRLILERYEERVVLHANAIDFGDIMADHAQHGSASNDRFEEVGQSSQSHVHKQSAIENINGSPFELTWDPGSAAISTAVQIAAATYPLSSIPVLNSLVGAAASLYLDFDGHFDATWGSYSNITTPVFDQDSDPTTFSDSELISMRDIWTAVAEDYAPFKINVTTVQPASFANGVSMRVAIGGDGAWTGGTYGGIAYVSSFTSSIVNTSYVFPKNLSNGYARYTAEAISHEAGHSFGLQHQSQYDSSGTKINEYYGGSGDGRAPIMGTSYYATRGLWWYGTSSTGPNNYQDDLAILSNATNAFGYRVDDNPSVIPLAVSSREVSGAGIIEKITDQDVFSFSAAPGELNLSVSVALGAGIGNLNARLELRNSSGILLAANDPSSFGSSRTITQTVAAGDYRLVVASHGGYGDVGKYTVNGTIPIPSTINTPTSLIATALSSNQINLSWNDNANNEGGYVVDRSTTGGLTWTQVAVLPLDSFSYSDMTAMAGTPHYYRVSAFNGSVVSSYSNQAIVTTVPAAPSLLSASVLWTDRTYLAWGNVDGETSFKIERSSDGGSTWSQIATTAADVTRYQDSGLQAATTYSYRVRAINASGDSDYSNLANATTFSATPTAFGSQDGAYIVESWSGTYNDLRIQLVDQKIVAAGSRYSTDPNAPNDHRMAIARYNATGVVDGAYGTGGVTAPAFLSTIEYGNALVLQPDGKAVVAGLANSAHATARFNANGLVDTSFGSGGLAAIDVRPDAFYSPASGVGLQSTGKVVVAGISLSSTASDPAVVARFTVSGALDTGKNGFGKVVQGKALGYTLSTFGESYNSFNDLAIQSDDKVVAVGQMYDSGGTNRRFVVARYTASGILDSKFNGIGYSVLLPSGISESYGSAVAVQPDGKIVVTGNCSGIDGSPDLLVARYNTNGTLDTSFAGGSGYVRLDRDGTASQTSESGNDVVIQPDGKIVVVGGYAVGANPSGVLVARLNSSGSLDSGFGSGGFKIGSLSPELDVNRGLSGQGVALLADGSIVVSGSGNWAPAGNSGLQYYHPLLMRFSGATVTPAAGGAMAVSNTNPKGIAEPPTSASLNIAPAYLVGNNNVLAGSAIASSFSQARTSSQSVSAVTESVDEFMSQLADSLPVATISVSKGPSTPFPSRTRLDEYQSIDLALADEGLNNSLHTMANELLISTLL